MGNRKPYLFYYEEAVDAWIPAPDMVENIIDVTGQLEPGETMEIRFKRLDLSNYEYQKLPEA